MLQQIVTTIVTTNVITIGTRNFTKNCYNYWVTTILDMTKQARQSNSKWQNYQQTRERGGKASNGTPSRGEHKNGMFNNYHNGHRNERENGMSYNL